MPSLIIMLSPELPSTGMTACSSPNTRWILPSLIALSVLALLSLLVVQASQANDLGHEQTLSVPFGAERVALRVATGSRYGLDEDADDEWGRILPREGHVVHLAASPSSSPEPYTVTLFHQLKCLQIIRSQYLTHPSQAISPHTRHCMNYLRQTLYCHLNMGIESVEDAEGRASRDYDAVCKDWTKVYEEAERNQKAFAIRG